MRFYRKTLSLLLTLSLLFSLGVPAFAAVDASLPVPAKAIPEGFHITGLTKTDENGTVWYCIETSPSKYGLTHVKWISKTGKEASPEELPGVNDVHVDTLTTNFPARYDAREEGLITPVEDQIGGTCWAHAAAAAMEAAAVKKGIYTADGINISEYHIVWNAYHGYEAGITDSRNDGESPYASRDILGEGGNYLAVGLAVLNGEGPADERRYGLNEDLDDEAFYGEMTAAFNFTNRFDRDLAVTGINTFDSTVEGIKTAVSTFGAVQISYYAATDGDRFYLDDGYVDIEEKDYFNIIWNCKEVPCAYYFPYPVYSNHAVTVVGWDDDFSCDNFNVKNRPAHDGAFLVKNSWGTYFGNEGYFWISYDDPTIDEVVAYGVAPVEDYAFLHSHTGFGADTLFSGTNQGTKLRAAANVFTAERDEALTAVSCGQETSGTLSVAVYGDLPETVTDPTAGTLLYSGTLAGDGSVWLPFPSPVAVSAGQRFAVVFTDVSSVRTEGMNKSYSGYKVNYTSHPGESFVRLNEKWKDLNTITSANGDRFNNAAISVAARLAPTARPRVTFTCPGYYTSTVEADENGVVALPATEGHTWACTLMGKPFTGTGVNRDLTVTAHCYPTEGTTSAASSCVTEYRCIYCENEVKEAKDGHDWQWITDEEPNCLNGGWQHEACTRCGMRRGADIYIEPNGVHQWDWYTVTTPTCGADGCKQQICRICGNTNGDLVPIPATGEHSWSWIVDSYPTCGADGLKFERCDLCGTTKNETVIPATGEHSFIRITDAVPTCTDEGWEHEECQYCGIKGAEYSLPAKDHSYAQWGRREPTCVDKGYITWRCPDCGDAYDEPLGLLPHDPSDWIEDVPATGTEPGHRYKQCLFCGTVLLEEEIPAGGQPLLGDVDDNGKIEPADARLALRQAIGLEHYAEGSREFKACDVDRNGKVETKDARYILRKAVGLTDAGIWD